MHNLEKMPEEGILLPKNPASKTRIFFELTEALEKKEPLFVEGISDSLKSLLALGFRGKWILYLCKTEERAKEILQDGKIFAENCLLFPAKDYLFYKADTRGNYISRERSECLRQLVEEEEGDHSSGNAGKVGGEKCLPSGCVYGAAGTDSFSGEFARQSSFPWISKGGPGGEQRRVFP